jgi:predicted phosphodiesterase
MATRIAVVSDVHGSLHALEAVVADIALTAPDVVLHGGDLAVNGASPDDVVTTIRELGWEGVVGNTDEILWTLDQLPHKIHDMPRFEPILRAMYQDTGPATLDLLSEDNLQWLQTLPAELRFDNLALIHASPRDLWRAPLPSAADDELQSVYGPLNRQIAVYGHIHRPFVRHLPGLVVANSGSAGLSWDGDPRASYLLIEESSIEIRRVEYPVDEDIRDLYATSYPLADWLAEMRRTARYVFPNIGAP